MDQKSDLISRPLLIILSLFSMVGLLAGQYNSTDHVNERELFPWPEGIHFAVSLTFDDARFSQIDSGIPLLNAYNIKATFYLSPENIEPRIEGWRAAIINGHEIGNHSMTHPCTGNYAFSRNNALENYTLEQMADELDKANAFILSVLNICPMAFAYPCGQSFVGFGIHTRSYVPLVAERFVTGRKWLSEAANDPYICDMAQLMAMESDQKSFAEIVSLMEDAKAEGRWLILVGHEIGDTGFQTTSLKMLDQLCQYANNEHNGVWMDTVSRIAAYILSHK